MVKTGHKRNTGGNVCRLSIINAINVIIWVDYKLNSFLKDIDIEAVNEELRK